MLNNEFFLTLAINITRGSVDWATTATATHDYSYSYFASSAKAIIPEAIAVVADVPENSSVHCLLPVVVICGSDVKRCKPQ